MPRDNPARPWGEAALWLAVLAPLFFLLGKLLAGDHRVRLGGKLAIFLGLSAFAGIGAEILIDTAWVKNLGRPLWTYRLLPVHQGYTSVAGLVIWPLYGFYVYMVHESIERNPRLRLVNTDYWKGILMGVDALFVDG